MMLFIWGCIYHKRLTTIRWLLKKTKFLHTQKYSNTQRLMFKEDILDILEWLIYLSASILIICSCETFQRRIYSFAAGLGVAARSPQCQTMFLSRNVKVHDGAVRNEQLQLVLEGFSAENPHEPQVKRALEDRMNFIFYGVGVVGGAYCFGTLSFVVFLSFVSSSCILYAAVNFTSFVGQKDTLGSPEAQTCKTSHRLR